MMLDFLSERPKEKTTKYLLIFSLPLLIIATSIVMYLLKLSNYLGNHDGYDGISCVMACHTSSCDRDGSHSI